MNNSSTYYWAVHIIILIPLTTYSQPDSNLFNFEYNLYPNNNIENNKGDLYNTLNTDLTATLKFPVLLKSKITLINNVDFQSQRTTGLEFVNDYPFIQHISGIGYSLTLIKNINSNKVILTSGLNYSTNKFSDINLRNYIYKGAAMFVHINEDKKLNFIGAGIGLTTDFGKPTILPFLLLQYNFTSRVHLNTFFPGKSELSFAFSEKSKIGILQKVEMNALFFADKYQSDTSQFAKIRNFNTGIFWEQKVFKAIYLSVSTGLVLKNTLLIYNNDFKKTDEVTGRNNYFFNIKLMIKTNNSKK